MPSDLVVAVNALFPNVLQHACASEDVRLIHTSTDGVFGTAGPYFESDAPDAKDLYGRSKALGEPEGAMTLRASIVGLGGRHSLLEWVCQQAQAGERVRGYTSCFWNGITAIEYARCCDQIMKGLWRPGVFQLFSDHVVSKFQLIRQFIEIAALVVELEEDDTVQSQRVLGTKQGLNGGLCVKDLNFQLERLHDDRRQSC
jgi:dTDP-4-dehydrorhamnose reductase